MERYLLFDAGCAVCHQLAQAIEEVAAGKLQARSIRDPQAREWLERAYPEGWAHQPYLVTVDGERVQAYAGLDMALRLGWLLGPRQAWRVWNLGVPSLDVDRERRQFLRRVTGLLAGLVLFLPGEMTSHGPQPSAEAQAPGQEPDDVICLGCSCCWETVWDEGCCCGISCCGAQGEYDYCRWHLYVWRPVDCGCAWNCSTSPCVSYTLCAC